LINIHHKYTRRNISDTSATPPGIKREWYVCMYVLNAANALF
jgi:hypothetical protein